MDIAACSEAAFSILLWCAGFDRRCRFSETNQNALNEICNQCDRCGCVCWCVGVCVYVCVCWRVCVYVGVCVPSDGDCCSSVFAMPCDVRSVIPFAECVRQKPCSLLPFWWNFGGRPLLYFVAPFDGEFFIAKLVCLIVDFAILSPFRMLINGHGFVVSNEILGYQMIPFHLASVRSLFSVIDVV